MSTSDSTIMSNSEGSQYVETEQCDFEETIGDKISEETLLGGIVEPYRFEPMQAIQRNKAEVKMKALKRSKHRSPDRFSSVGFDFPFNWQFIRDLFCIN